MTANDHPSSSELLVALREPEQAISTLEHIDECVACRVRLSRIRRASGLGAASANSLQRIVDASTPLPDRLAEMVSGNQDGTPQPNEVWRVGKSEALLVWIRQIFDDGVADVVPLVLDVDLADQESVLVDADATLLATEGAAMVSLRTHIHTGAFLNRVGTLNLGKDVAEVMAAMREGRRPSGVRVGPAIDDDDDQRIEYRQALRDLLAELTPSAWAETEEEHSATDGELGESRSNRVAEDVKVIKRELGDRLAGIQCRDPVTHTITIDGAMTVTSILKLVYLDTAVLVVILEGDRLIDFPEIDAVAAACRAIILSETDVHAVAVAIPRDNWPTLLFATAHMRDAIKLPRGASAGPTATVEGFGLVDTLCKYLEGAMSAWEVTERSSTRIGTANLHEIAMRHANSAVAKILIEGGRARQVAKKVAWGSLPGGLDEQVARFVVAVASQRSVDDAVAELFQEGRND